MKFLVKYISVLGLTGLSIFHIKDLTPFTECLYYSIEYTLLTILFLCLAKFFMNFRDKLFFQILSSYFGLKILYNIGLYIPLINDKFYLWNTELWSFIVTLLIITILIIIQINYVGEKGRIYFQSIRKKGKDLIYACSSINFYNIINNCKRVKVRITLQKIWRLCNKNLRKFSRSNRCTTEIR